MLFLLFQVDASANNLNNYFKLNIYEKMNIN
jgi:hypothetical protein